MIQLLADLLTVAGLVGMYIAIALTAAIALKAAQLKIREMWRGK